MDNLDILFEPLGLSLSSVQREQFSDYYRLLIEWNKRINLTSITAEQEVAVKHFYDSITPSIYFPFSKGKKVCDVGSGAGFPGIPLKIVNPGIELTIVDSLQKRLAFLQALVQKLELNHISLIHERAETFAQLKSYREHFDIVVARAVAGLSVLSEYCLPLLRRGGLFIAMKGPNVENEIKQAGRAIQILGGSFRRQEKLELPFGMGGRSLLVIEKTGLSPIKYPRKPGTPVRKPL